MVARSATLQAFTPAAKPAVLTAADGSLAAIQEPSRIVVVELPSCAPFAELGIDPSAIANDIAWVGTPPRLLVLSRYDSHCIAHLVDPFGPRTIAELRLESPMQMCASVLNHALLVGAAGTAILVATDKVLDVHPLPTRTRPLAAGAAGAQLMIAVPGTIEEWDPISRMPKRRLKLPRPAAITAVGGSDRVVWLTTDDAPSRIEAISLVNRGQPKFHELPEPIAQVASQPHSDLLACMGATSGRIWVVDLDGRKGLRMIGPEGIDRTEAVALVVGRVSGVLAAQTGRPIVVVGLDPLPHTQPRGIAEVDAPPAPAIEVIGDVATTVTLAVPEMAAVPHAASEGASSATSGPSASAPPPHVATSQGAPASSTPTSGRAPGLTAASGSGAAPSKAAQSILKWPTPDEARALVTAKTAPVVIEAPRPPWGDKGDAFSSWRERVKNPRARTAEPLQSLWDDDAAWRDRIVAWFTAGAQGAAPDASPFAALIARLDLSDELLPALALLYAHHLAGEHGAPPMAISRVLGGRWDEALGRGELAQRGVVIIRDSRAHLAPALLRVLDELLPTTGVLIGAPGPVSLIAPCTVVADGPLPIIAEACLASIGGAILAAHPDVDPQELVREACAYGAAAMLRVTPRRLEGVPTDEPIVLVVDDDATADELGVPRLR